MTKLPIFITGNQSKADYLAQMLGVKLAHQTLHLEELQSQDLEEIIEHKVRQAYELIQRPVLVEDVSLGFAALNNLPGPFIKFFAHSPDGLEMTCRMLDGFSDRSATAVCLFAYFDGKKITKLRGQLHGSIAAHPRGENGFGWDKIFIPHGFNGKTRAELTPSDDVRTYATIKPLAELRAFLRSLQ